MDLPTALIAMTLSDAPMRIATWQVIGDSKIGQIHRWETPAVDDTKVWTVDLIIEC